MFASKLYFKEIRYSNKIRQTTHQNKNKMKIKFSDVPDETGGQSHNFCNMHRKLTDNALDQSLKIISEEI